MTPNVVCSWKKSGLSTSSHSHIVCDILLSLSVCVSVVFMSYKMTLSLWCEGQRVSLDFSRLSFSNCHSGIINVCINAHRSASASLSANLDVCSAVFIFSSFSVCLCMCSVTHYIWPVLMITADWGS